MLGTIITIIIILHLIMFIFIYCMYNQLQAYKKMHVEDLTTLMDTYMEEIKTENIRLEKELKKSNVKSSGIEETLRTEIKLEQHNQLERFDKNTYKGPAIEKISKTESVQQPSIEAQVLQLHAKGMASADIAKTLKCGKTEAELIITLHAKNK